MHRHLFWIALISIAFFGVCTSSLKAQDTSSSRTVNMVITVEAHPGTNPAPVDRADVLVYQNKIRDKVTSWVPAQGDHAQFEMFILLDDSSGMSLGNHLDEIRQFINAQPPTTKVGLAYMQNGTAAIVQNLTEDHAQVAKSVRLPLGVAEAMPAHIFL